MKCVVIIVAELWDNKMMHAMKKLIFALQEFDKNGHILPNGWCKFDISS